MNVYVIYKFAEYDKVKTIVDQIGKELPSLQFFMFDPLNTPKLWHLYAVRKLTDSQLVLLFDLSSEGQRYIGKHISWELKKAAALKKRIVIFKSDPTSDDRAWYDYDYSEKDPRHPRFQTVALDKAVTFMKQEYDWNMDDHLIRDQRSDAPLTETEIQLLLEQYRIMIETSEKLMERRQETVNLYTTLCTTLIAFIGASFAFGSLLVSSIISLISGLVLIVLCHNWKMSLQSFDLNNTGKFMVIDALEKQLPAEMFQCEYKYNKINGVRSFSSREKVLPQIFTIFGVALILAAIVLFCFA